MSQTEITAPPARARAVESHGPPPEAGPSHEFHPHHIHRITATARPTSSEVRTLEMGQIMQLPNQPTPKPAVQAPPVPSAPMTLAEATSMLPGLQAAVTGAEDSQKAGGCKDLSAADLATARAFKDKMAQFVAGAAPGATFTVEKPWLDAADNVVKCAIAAEKAAPNTGAYIALGVIAAGAIVALSV